MLIEITDATVIAYQQARLEEGAAAKTINEEVGILFRVMGGIGETVHLKLKRAKKLKLTQPDDVGRALSQEEEQAILLEAHRSASPHLYTVVMIALHTGMREGEIRHLQWRQIDFFKQILTVGKSKTPEGTGRTIPLNSELLHALSARQAWYKLNVSSPTMEHYVFPRGTHSRYEATKPVSSIQTSWDRIRRRAKVEARFHDLRHTLITKLCESGAGEETIRGIVGHVSQRILARYAHIRTEAKRRALQSIVFPVSHPEAAPIGGTESMVIH
jgi:integrase